mmetsp:Transcript_42516/g.112085  ORF Transcript_42516/g.112085 Transcript_42516/m.112085 type:complete len:205 (-) Transcript_42516:168-782(-)
MAVGTHEHIAALDITMQNVVAVQVLQSINHMGPILPNQAAVQRAVHLQDRGNGPAGHVLVENVSTARTGGFVDAKARHNSRMAQKPQRFKLLFHLFHLILGSILGPHLPDRHAAACLLHKAQVHLPQRPNTQRSSQLHVIQHECLGGGLGQHRLLLPRPGKRQRHHASGGVLRLHQRGLRAVVMLLPPCQGCLNCIGTTRLQQW